VSRTRQFGNERSKKAELYWSPDENRPRKAVKSTTFLAQSSDLSKSLASEDRILLLDRRVQQVMDVTQILQIVHDFAVSRDEDSAKTPHLISLDPFTCVAHGEHTGPRLAQQRDAGWA
jgi:hypothetical protein